NQRIKDVSENVAQDSLNWNEEKKAFVATHGEEGNKANSKITSLQYGNIAENSTDAITGGQLYSLGSDVAKYFGGGASYAEGTWTAPTFTVKTIKDDGVTVEEKDYSSVAEAFAGIGTSFTNIKNDITNVVSDSLVKWDDEHQLIKIGSEKSGNIVTIADKDGKGRALSGVKDAEQNDEAVNKGQLDKNVNKLTKDIDDVRSVAVFYDTEEDTEEVSALTRSARKAKQNSVTFGNPKEGTVSLRNVGNGKVTKDSTEAVNGSQLYSVGDKVATYFGGSASFKEGVLTAPTYKISNVGEDGTVTANSYGDVGSAFEGIDTNFKNVNTHLTNEVKNFEEKITNITQAVQGDALLWSKDAGAFVAKHGTDKEKSKITSLQAGKIAEDSSDAINGSQLYSMGDTVAKYFGGGASYENGTWTAPKFTVKKFDAAGEATEENYDNVADAFAEISSSVTKIHNEVTNQIDKVVGDSLVKQDETTKVIKIGAETEGAGISFANRDGTDRTLSGVKAAENDNEAVNKAQLEKGLKDLSTSLQSDESAVVHYDKNTDENGTINYASVTFGKGKDSAAVGLHNVADGAISEGSHDVVNGGQINKISQDVAKFLGGEASFKDGVLTEPTYKLSKISPDGKEEDKSFKNVGSAFEGLDENIKNVNQRIKEVSQGVAQDSLSWDKEALAFVAKHGEEGNKANSKITSLQNGTIGENSTDAVNGSQLYSLGSNVAKSLGGNAGYENGAWTAPTFTVKTVKDDGVTVEEKQYNTVADALADVGTSFTNIKNDITNVVSDSLVKWDEEKQRIKIGGEKSGNTITIADKDGKGRALSGVKDAEQNDEAVNKGQLDKNVDKLTKDINDVRSVAVFYDTEEDTEEVSALTRSARKAKQNSVTFGNPKEGTVALHNVGDGKIGKDSHDVINGGQIDAISQDIAKVLGGGTTSNNGTFTGPTYKLSKISTDGKEEAADFKNVGSAFEGLDTNIKNVNNHLTNEVKKFEENITNITQEVQGDALLWDKDEGAFVATHGED
ncbi:hypothetical protein MEI_00577, partial [Bartonella vinsonii subsp. arupensis Pm136co]